MTTTHSKLPPSSASRRMACPGSRAMCERHGRNEESEASKEGTLAHELAAIWLSGQNTIVSYPEEMIEGAKLYTDIIHRILMPRNVNIEKRVNIDTIHPDMWGTPDAWGVLDKCVLHVFDYKFGFTPVDAFENWQLIAYACGIIQAYPDITDIYLHIIQPRDYVSSSKHKMWHITAKELEGYRQRLVTSEALAMSPHPELKVSTECKYCPARHACPALREAALGATEIAFRDVPQGLTPSQVGNELKLLHDARDLLDFRITALETEATHFIQSGMNVDNYELTHSAGRLAWKGEIKEIFEAAMLAGVDVRKDDIMTPTQAIKAGMPEETVLKYSDRKHSLKLSRVDVNKAKAVFKQP